MAVSRREFLQRSGLLAAGAVLPVSAFAGTKPEKTPGGASGAPGTGTGLGTVSGDAPWSLASFQQALGTEFAVQQTPGGSPVWLLLTAVTDTSTSPATSKVILAVPTPQAYSVPPPMNSFLLSFSASLAQPLTQGTYPVNHGTLGMFSLFIVPGAQGGQMYYAVVNRMGVKGTPVLLGPPTPGPTHGGPAAGGTPATGNGNTTVPAGGAVPNPGSGSGRGLEQGPMPQPNLSRE
jgi:uncharacterized protein DUF6916